jgi:hypothetical protein
LVRVPQKWSAGAADIANLVECVDYALLDGAFFQVAS